MQIPLGYAKLKAQHTREAIAMTKTKGTEIEAEHCFDNAAIIKGILMFLNVLLPITLAKRIVVLLLFVAGMPVSRVTRLVGMCDSTAYRLRKSMREMDVLELLRRKEGSGSQSKTFGLEAEIVAEIERNNYHTRQQIADMIEEKFHIHLSVATVGRLLKKTTSND